MNKQQQEQLGFMFMWSNDWAVALDLACRDTLAVGDIERHKIDNLDWYAFMARKECLELGLDPEITLQPALIKCADRWYADNVKGTEDEWCFEQAAQ